MQKYSGFTLFEFIAVIAIISILSVMVSFTWQGTTIDLEAQAQQVAANVRYAQALAMTRGQRFRWAEVSATTYQVVDNSGNPIMLAQGNTTVILGSGISFGALSNLPNSLVAFDGRGTPYVDTATPGTALSSSASISLSSGGQTKTVVISPETGRTIVQ